MSKYLHLTDYTSLNQTDTPATVAEFVNADLGGEPASFCVYSSLVESAALALANRSTMITAVCGSFPSSQTFLEVKLLDVAMAIENGADEIDIVANIGAILEGNIEQAMGEIRAIAQEIDGDAVLKVILETGILADEQLIYSASLAAMEAGADFIKTSTGKAAVGATPDAVRAMCRAIKEYHSLTGIAKGIKIAGGVRTDAQVEHYISIVREELGDQWIVPALLRVGRSQL